MVTVIELQGRNEVINSSSISHDRKRRSSKIRPSAGVTKWLGSRNVPSEIRSLAIMPNAALTFSLPVEMHVYSSNPCAWVKGAGTSA